MSEEFDFRLEATLSALNILTENVEAAARCRESQMNVRETLQEIIKLADKKAECVVNEKKKNENWILIIDVVFSSQEIIEYSESLLFKLFHTSTESNADR